ncbi:hypothetical protein AVEN_52995-1 [Araneus ventricosus]|uniref:RNase H type-1 domain-containing protein n=1 Tax=Araneus ventricosus TaxID=182803 RepID=A0A4Y2P2M9_ARAVE|nr:hypothetical protein AVEN_52995-1 [Araneus ventricosus]
MGLNGMTKWAVEQFVLTILVKFKVSVRLSNNASVFIAEAVAILETIKKILHNDHVYYIFTDSRSVLMALASCSVQTTIIEEIKSLLKNKRNFKMCWIKPAWASVAMKLPILWLRRPQKGKSLILMSDTLKCG